MSIEVTGDALPLPLGKPAGRHEKLPSRIAADKVPGATPGEPADRAAIVRARVELGRMLAANERLSALATSTRVRDASLGKLSEVLNQMRDTLLTITKNYPPFPPGSEERVSLLRSYAGLRKQIAQLMVPPEGDGVKQESNAKEKERKGAFTFVLELTGTVRTVPRSDVRVGPTGLVIPELQEQASESEVQAALEELEGATRAVRDRQTQLQGDAAGRADAEINHRKASALGTGVDGRMVPPGESAVRMLAQSARDGLAQESAGIVHAVELRDLMTGT